MNPESTSSPATLDPPGTIVVLGTTAIGIEAALYGRYLGYNVTLIAGSDGWRERDWNEPQLTRIGPTFDNDWFAHRWLGTDDLATRWDDAMPMMPDRCLSPLAFSALDAQREDVPRPLPSTMRQWVHQGLGEVIQTDLLRGRVFADTFADSIELVPIGVEEDEDEGNGKNGVETSGQDDEVPPDFLLTLRGAPISQAGEMQLQCECVIVADIKLENCKLAFNLPTDYFFQMDQEMLATHQDAAQMLRNGWQQITAIYAQLADRSDLDLYRPLRL